MYAVANCRASILRETGQTEFGDVADTGEGRPVMAGVPAQILETSRTVTNPNSQTPRTIRIIKARLPSTIQVRVGDRVRDDGSGTVYAVTEIFEPRAVGFTPDVELVLQKIG